MRPSVRNRIAAAAAAIALGGVLALLASAGPAVAFFSPPLFLDIRVESPATLVARGAAVDVPLEVTCNAAPSASVDVSVTQKAGSGVAQGFAFANVGCTGSHEQVVIRVQANSGNKTFKKGIAVASAEIFGCSSNFSVCGSETDSATISIQR